MFFDAGKFGRPQKTIPFLAPAAVPGWGLWLIAAPTSWAALDAGAAPVMPIHPVPFAWPPYSAAFRSVAVQSCPGPGVALPLRAHPVILFFGMGQGGCGLGGSSGLRPFVRHASASIEPYLALGLTRRWGRSLCALLFVSSVILAAVPQTSPRMEWQDFGCIVFGFREG